MFHVCLVYIKNSDEKSSVPLWIMGFVLSLWVSDLYISEFSAGLVGQCEKLHLSEGSFLG